MKRIATLVITASLFLTTCKQATKPADTTANASTADTIVVKDWERFYDSSNIEGCFVLYNLNKKEIKVYNPGRAATRFTPASTFKIFNSMVALETGAVKDENEIIKWDGEKRRIEEWNQDLDMKKAFKVSAVWFYQEVARRAGKERMQSWLDTVGYGNHSMGTAKVDDFWLEDGLKISPYEQVQFLEKLYKDSLPFSKRTMLVVKDVMKVDDVPYIMRAKTGWALRVKTSVGWYVGWVEKDNEVYFFANNINMTSDEQAAARIQVTKNILKSEGIIPAE